MSIIAAGTTTTTALSSTGNTDGTLQFQVNGTTASVTLNTLGAVGVGSSPSFGTSGQALVSAGSTAAPSWANVTTSPAGTTGQIQYNNAGAFGAVSSGTAGQLLTSAGAGVVPTWSSPSSGALVYLSTLTASNSATLTYSGFSSTYSAYMVIIKNLKCSSASGPTLVLQMRMSDASILSLVSGGLGIEAQAPTTVKYPSAIGLQVLAASDNANTAGTSGNFYIYSPLATSQVTTGTFHTAGTTYQGIGGTWFATGGFQAISSLASSGFRLLYSSGNISSGTVDIYGIANS